MHTAKSCTHSQLTRSLGVDADRIFNATVGQRSHILQQLEEAESNARDALFTLESMRVKLASETAEIKSTLSHLSEIIPPDEFEKMCDFAFGKSKNDWEDVWKHEWVGDTKERVKFIKRRRGSSKKRRPSRRDSSPLPPSSPPPPTSPGDPQGGLPPRTGPIRTNRSRSTHPRSPLLPDGFRAPQGFVDKLRSTAYRPTWPQPAAGPSQPRQNRRLRRDDRLLQAHQDGTLVIVDPQEDVEAHRREIREKIELQTHWRLRDGIETSLQKMVQASGSNRSEDPPVTWSRVVGHAEPLGEEPVEPLGRDPDRDEDEQEPDSEPDPHARGDRQ